MNPEHANMMARYNQWMNENLYEACADLSDEDRKADRRLFFGSIHGTLNHLLLADKIWLGRFIHEPFEARSLDQELFAGFPSLREARADTDRLILEWTAGLTEAELARDLEYRSVRNPVPRSLPMWIAVTHLFNHQTHHRGQVTAALSQLGIDYGGTDLIASPALPAVP
ncbi:MAG: DinB family protein [Gammaproteobacteria bacterium]|nr:DinB family protein [Gammaproteobacteria bacterium]